MPQTGEPGVPVALLSMNDAAHLLNHQFVKACLPNSGEFEDRLADPLISREEEQLPARASFSSKTAAERTKLPH